MKQKILFMMIDMNVGGTEKAFLNLVSEIDFTKYDVTLLLLEEKGGVYNVCDTKQSSFGELSVSVAKQLGKGKPLNIPYWVAWCMAKIGDLFGNKAPINSNKLEKMTKSLTFSNDKARKELNWEPMDVLTNFQI